MRSAGLNPLRRLCETALFSAFDTTSAGRLYPPARKTRRVLLLSVSAGAGHVRAAEALAACAQRDFARLSVRHVDLMSLVPRWFSMVYRDLYLSLSSGLPEAWGWLYRKTDCQTAAGMSDTLRRWLQQGCARRLRAEIAREQPDVIVCTHFLPAELLAQQRKAGQLDCPVWVQVTDFDLHRLWVHDGISGYFVGNDELALRLHAQGIPVAQTIVSGIPLMPGFAAHPARHEVAASLGLDPARPTVLMMSGGAGAGLDANTISALLASQPQLQLIVLAGRNDALRRSLQGLAAGQAARLRCLGFTDDVHRMMACADLAITKPGGLSTSECLAMGLPMLLVNPIPGQEERNAAWLLQEGAAIRADDPVTLQIRLQRLLGDTALLARMRERALALAKPHAAQTVLKQIA